MPQLRKTGRGAGNPVQLNQSGSLAPVPGSTPSPLRSAIEVRSTTTQREQVRPQHPPQPQQKQPPPQQQPKPQQSQQPPKLQQSQSTPKVQQSQPTPKLATSLTRPAQPAPSISISAQEPVIPQVSGGDNVMRAGTLNEKRRLAQERRRSMSIEFNRANMLELVRKEDGPAPGQSLLEQETQRREEESRRLAEENAKREAEERRREESQRQAEEEARKQEKEERRARRKLRKQAKAAEEERRRLEAEQEAQAQELGWRQQEEAGRQQVLEAEEKERERVRLDQQAILEQRRLREQEEQAERARAEQANQWNLERQAEEDRWRQRQTAEEEEKKRKEAEARRAREEYERKKKELSYRRQSMSGFELQRARKLEEEEDKAKQDALNKLSGLTTRGILSADHNGGGAMNSPRSAQSQSQQNRAGGTATINQMLAVMVRAINVGSASLDISLVADTLKDIVSFTRKASSDSKNEDKGAQLVEITKVFILQTKGLIEKAKTNASASSYEQSKNEIAATTRRMLEILALPDEFQFSNRTALAAALNDLANLKSRMDVPLPQQPRQHMQFLEKVISANKHFSLAVEAFNTLSGPGAFQDKIDNFNYPVFAGEITHGVEDLRIACSVHDQRDIQSAVQKTAAAIVVASHALIQAMESAELQDARRAADNWFNVFKTTVTVLRKVLEMSNNRRSVMYQPSDLRSQGI
eukprot:TRINITY_DN6389_c0_g1_i3.p1 TRINITY_DN6389_c0_g1~~TRINITY_DN6389_c0_g1_i3.p1  ORF type:complete len:698 (+),score=185.16 TRINITY_DN6389_c0_g1_i3:174-2267(+)